MSENDFIVARVESQKYIVEARGLTFEEAGEKIIELDTTNPQEEYIILEEHKESEP